jgi:hypothetical protein
MRYADGSVSSRNKIGAVSGADNNDTEFYGPRQDLEAKFRNIFSIPNPDLSRPAYNIRTSHCHLQELDARC